MIYAILAWNVILTAFAVWAFIKARAYKNDQLAKMASLALDSTIIGKKIKVYADAQAAMQEVLLTHTDKLDALKNLADENMKHFDVLDEGFNGMAGTYGKFVEDMQALRSDLDALKAEFDGTVKDLTEAETEKAKAEARSEALWQEARAHSNDYCLESAAQALAQDQKVLLGQLDLPFVAIIRHRFFLPSAFRSGDFWL